MPETNTKTDSQQVIATTPPTTTTATQQPNGNLISFYDGHRDAIQWGGFAVLIVCAYLAYRWMYGANSNNTNFRQR